MQFQISLVLALLLLQAPTSPARIGDAAEKLTRNDIAGIETALALAGKAEKPWLLVGGSEPQGHYVVHAYLTNDSGPTEVRRSMKIVLTRQSDHDVWLVNFMDEIFANYAQVALPGRSLDSITSDRDTNQPFRVEGNFQNADLASIVTFIRTGPPSPLVVTPVPGNWPIDTISRAPDGTVAVSLHRPGGPAGLLVYLIYENGAWRVMRVLNWIA